jgi:hypothetical protein
MPYRIEKLCKVYSPRLGDQLVWRPTHPSGGGAKPYEWSTLKEAESFLGLFYDVDPTTVRIVEVEPVAA